MEFAMLVKIDFELFKDAVTRLQEVLKQLIDSKVVEDPINNDKDIIKNE